MNLHPHGSYKNCSGLRKNNVFWKGRSDDVILVDPAWKVDVPAKNRDWKSDPKTTEELMAILNAGHEDTDGNVQLLDAQGNCCGLLCKDFNGSGDIYARLVFNQERHLVGMCVFDDAGRQLYREDGADLSEDEDDVTGNYHNQPHRISNFQVFRRRYVLDT